ncbi:uncharacterized protein LOC128726872 [Anopheles nili]|uniref:uncharacterized protein LOC128726872 n=1 Tax=Anopheles nili TaxID=185578 RepID=UPI00237B1C1F|nr:uncharacterized protein LOC128726872 [Anopheles nili]
MERYLRFYIKFQGYMIGTLTLLFSVLLTIVIYEHNDVYYPMEFLYNFRFMGSTALILGLFWLVAGLSFLYAVHREVKQCMLPFALLYLFDVTLLAIRDLVMLWLDRRWYTMVFSNLPVLFVVLFVTCYLFMTLIALDRLFSSDPKPQAGDNFIRFNNGVTNPAATEDEVALVNE